MNAALVTFVGTLTDTLFSAFIISTHGITGFRQYQN